MQPSNPRNPDNSIPASPPPYTPQAADEDLVTRAAQIERSFDSVQSSMVSDSSPGTAPIQEMPIPPNYSSQNVSPNLMNAQNTIDISDKGLPGLPPVTPEKKEKKIILWVVIILMTGLAGYFIYTTFFTNKSETNSITQTTQKSTEDKPGLVEASIKSTSFLRPEGWVKTSEDGASYGISGSTINTWNAIIVIMQDDPEPSLVNAPDSIYEQMRKNPVSNIVSDGIADRFLERTGEKCVAPATLTFSPDTLIVGNSIGLYISEASCPTANGKIILKERTIVGKDGVKRYGILLATDDEWSKNADLFQRVLDSLGQTS